MSKFYNRFNPAPCKNKDKVYDRHDEVDRLSYVDNTLMVQRFINEGKSLMAARAQALRSGSFSGNMQEIENDNSIPIPVYGSDPAIAQVVIDQAMQNFSSTASAGSDNATSNDAITKPADAVNASSSANSES